MRDEEEQRRVGRRKAQGRTLGKEGTGEDDESSKTSRESKRLIAR